MFILSKNKFVVMFIIIMMFTSFLNYAQQIGPDGSLTFTYPIQLPAGVGGIQPSLSLTYNSNMGNGMCGLGWVLSGLSAITRDRSYDVNFDKHDHYLYSGQRLIYLVADGYFHTENESYLRIAAYNSSGYRTGPIAGIAYWVVTLKNGTKMYYGYNSTNHTENTDGHIDAVAKDGKALLWSLSRVEDVHGNYYFVKYLEDAVNGDYYPKKIVYTNGNEPAMIRIVEFLYGGERTDHGKKFIPTYWDMDKRLDEIIIKCKNTRTQTVSVIQKYRLDYQYSDLSDRSIICSIEELGSGEAILQRTEFEWSSDFVEIDLFGEKLTKVTKSEAGIPAYFLPGDYNGDGRGDIIYARGQGTGKDRYQYYIYLGTESGGLVENGFYDPGLSLSEAGIPGHFVPGDFNGDGITDLVYARGQGTGEDRYQFFIYLGTESGNLVANGYVETGVTKSEAGIPAYFIPGDYNGDGITDIVYARGQGTGKDRYEYYFYLGTESGELVANGFFNPDLSLSEAGIPGHFVPGDFNGDGRSDLVYARGQGTGTDRYQFFIYLGTESGGFVKSENEYVDTGVSMSEAGIPAYFIPGDFNGDGMTDIVYARGQGTGEDRYEYYIYLGTESGEFVANGYYNPGISLSEQDIPEHFLPGDYNGDRITDIIYARGQGTGEPDRYEYFRFQGNENGELSLVEIYDTNKVWQEGDIPTYFVTGDFNGDGKTNVTMARGETDTPKEQHKFIIYTENIPGQTDQIVLIRNKAGGTSGITYTSAPNVPGAVDSSQTSFPYKANKSARQLATSLVVKDGLGNNAVTSYGYYNGMFFSGEPDERRNVGFERTKVTNTTTGSYVEIEYFHKDDNPLFQTMVKRQTSFDLYDKKYNEELYIYDYQNKISATAKFHAVNFVFKRDEYTNDYDGTTTAEESRIQYAFYDAAGALTNYDDYGNLLRKKNYGNYNVQGDEIAFLTAYNYRLDEDHYIIVPKQKSTNAYNMNGEWVNASRVKYYYDNQPYGVLLDKGLCTRKEEKVKSDKWIATTYDYHADGRLKSTRDPLALAGGYDTTVQDYDIYDSARGQIYDTAANALGMTEFIYYDECLRPVETVDVNGISWFTAYDEFGRVEKTWGPGAGYYNPSTITEYRSAVFSPLQPVITMPEHIYSRIKDDSADGYYSVYEYFDGLGRTIQTKTEAENGQWRTTDSYYNESGKNYKTSVVYYSSGPEFTPRDESQKCTVIEYDDIGREVKVIHPDGSEKRIVYKKNKTIHLDVNNRATSTEVTGNTTTEIIYNGEYPEVSPDPQNPYSIVTTIVACNGISILQDENEMRTINDMLGRKESYTDPDMGTWIYTYDDNGNLLTQTNAEEQTISFDYDRLNRVRYKKYGSKVNTTYLYDGLDDEGNPDGEDHGECLGNLTKILYPGGEESYSYDTQGRVVSATKSIEGVCKTFDYQYDAMGRMIEETYPLDQAGERETVTYTYNEGGALYSVSGTDNYLSDIDYTVTGKADLMNYGNNTVIDYHYDPDTDRLNYISAGGVESILNFSYQYDTAGNITQKTDNLNFIYSEDYFYDDQYRLESAISHTDFYGTKTYAYDALNNIVNKDGNDYFYNYSHHPGQEAPLPHAVSSVEDNSGNILYTCEYDRNGNMTRSESPGTIVIRARNNSTELLNPQMELWITDDDIKEMKSSWTISGTDYNEYSWQGLWKETDTISVAIPGQGGIDIDSMEINGTSVDLDQNSIIFIDSSTVDIEGNSITRNVGTDAWDAGTASVNGFKGNGGIEFTAAQEDKHVICGLSAINIDASYDSINYGLVLNNRPRVHVFENGIDVTPPELKGYICYFTGDKLRVLRIGNTIVYQLNGNTIYESQTLIDPETELFMDCSLYSDGAAITDIKWVDIDAVSFKDVVNCEINNEDNSITRNAGTDAWDGGAASVNGFKGNGGIEFTAAQEDKYIICGLTSTNTDASYDSINFGLVLNNGSRVHIFQNGIDVTPPELKGYIFYLTGDKLRVLRNGNTIVYQLNGNPIYESQTLIDPETELFMDCSLYSDGAAITDIKWVDVDTMSFKDIVNTAVDSEDNSITRNAGTDAWDGGAASVNGFKGNGGIEFTPVQQDKHLMCGLSAVNTDADFDTIEYGLLLNNGSRVHVFENGIDVTPEELKGYIIYNTGSVLRVLRKGNTIVYQHNGETIYTSQTMIDPKTELFMDCSLYSDGAAITDIKWVNADTVSFTDVVKSEITPYSIIKSGPGATGISSLVRTITYDLEKRVTEINDNNRITTFTNNDEGRRIKKVEEGVTTYFFSDKYEVVVEDGVTKTISNYYANGQRIAQRTTKDSGSEVHYMYTDHLGSVTKLADENGMVIQGFAYSPFGEIVSNTRDAGSNKMYLFTGQKYDKQTELYYYGARYYDPVLGRFVQADTRLDGLNRYAYCANNPIMFKDPTGHFIVTWNFSSSGWSIGLNFIVGGFGLNGSWDGAVGVYGEVGPRFLCFGGATISAGVGYDFGSGIFYGNVSAGVSLGASIGVSASFDLTHGEYLGTSLSQGLSFGINFNLTICWDRNGNSSRSTGIGISGTADYNNGIIGIYSAVGSVRMGVSNGSFGFRAETILAGFRFTVGKFNSAHAYAAGLAVGISDTECLIALPFVGGFGYSFKYNKGFILKPLTFRVFGDYGGPGYTGKHYSGDPDYCGGNKGINVPAHPESQWIDSIDLADSFFKGHDSRHYIDGMDDRQSDQILVNDCTNAMNNPAGYNYNPWVNTQLLFASIFFTAANGGF